MILRYIMFHYIVLHYIHYIKLLHILYHYNTLYYDVIYNAAENNCRKIKFIYNPLALALLYITIKSVLKSGDLLFILK